MINHHNYYKWYFISKVKFNIIKYTKNRETALITHDKKITLRTLKVHRVQDIDFHLKALNWYKQKWNMYYSLAEYEDGIPNQKFNLKNRDNSDWKKEHWKSMIKYDLLLDIDASDHSEIYQAKKCAIKVCEKLSSSNIPIDIRFSGCGFHIVIPHSYFTEKNYSFNYRDENNIYDIYSIIAKKFAFEYSEMIDYNLNDPRRLCKIPYSLAIYEKNIYMCCPMDYERLKGFRLEDYEPENALKWLDV